MSRPLRYGSQNGHAEGEYVNRERERERERDFKLLSYLTAARYVHPWWHIERLTNVSLWSSTVSADGPTQPVLFAAHKQPLCWNLMYHSRIVLSVGGSVWYMIRNARCTVTIDSVLTNYKRQNALLFPVHAMFRHDCPLAVKPASMPRRLIHKKNSGEIFYLMICSFLLCLSWLLLSRVRKFQRDLGITLHFEVNYITWRYEDNYPYTNICRYAPAERLGW
jgi:hypothetical protein